MSNATFVHEIPLKTNAFQVRKLNIKFRALTQLYNTAIGEVFKRHTLMIADSRYQDAKALYKKVDTKQQAIDLFNKLKKDYCISKNDIQKYIKKCKESCYMKDHLDSDTIQIISDRAFDSYSNWIYGKRGKPRFKSIEKRTIRSIQGKKNACITFTKKGKIKWGKLQLDLILDFKDKYGVQAHALDIAASSWKEIKKDKDGNDKEVTVKGLKYCRIVRKFIKGQYRFYVQLVLRGTPKQKSNQEVAYGCEVGGDVGVSTIAAVSHEKAILKPFCDNLEDISKEIKSIQRKMSRSMRANNPDNFEKDEWVKKDKNFKRKKGKSIKGKRDWEKSNNYLKLKNELNDLYRKQAEKRQIEHNCLANDILEMGNIIKFEKNNYKAWQKGWFGKTIGFRAPSGFVSTLQRKVEKTGGEWYDINPWDAKLSQYCHVCNGYHKKTLDQRTHYCEGKPIAQRDLYSGALALYYDFEQKHVCMNHEEWKGLETALNDALHTLTKSRKENEMLSCLVADKKLIEKRDSHSKGSQIAKDKLNATMLQSNSIGNRTEPSSVARSA